MILRSAGLALLYSVFWVGHAAAADTTPTPIVVETKFVTPEGQERQAAPGDIVHEDIRTVSQERLIVVNTVSDACTSGWCHSFTAGDEFVQVGYGPRIYCTLTKTGKRDTLFSDYPAHSCVTRDFSKPQKLEIFGLKEFSDSLTIQTSPKPSAIRIEFKNEPLAAYPDWGKISPPNYVDGQFIVRFTGYEGGKIFFDLEHVPGIDGSADASTVNVGFTPNKDQMIFFPLAGAKADYQKLADSKSNRSDMAVFAGVRMKVKDVSANSLTYQIIHTNRYMQIFRGGYWQVSDKGEGFVMQTKYR